MIFSLLGHKFCALDCIYMQLCTKTAIFKGQHTAENSTLLLVELTEFSTVHLAILDLD